MNRCVKARPGRPRGDGIPWAGPQSGWAAVPPFLCPRLAGACIALLAVVMPEQVQASPPACMRDVVDVFLSSDVVVLAAPLEGRRVTYGDRVGLVSTYRVIERFKGRERAGDTVRIEDRCIDRPLPKGMEGYPMAREYCRGGYRPRLPGIDSRTGELRRSAKDGMVLFLGSKGGDGSPGRIYGVVPDSDYGASCSRKGRALTAQERAAIERIRSLQKRRTNILGIDGQ